MGPIQQQTLPVDDLAEQQRAELAYSKQLLPLQNNREVATDVVDSDTKIVQA